MILLQYSTLFFAAVLVFDIVLFFSRVLVVRDFMFKLSSLLL